MKTIKKQCKWCKKEFDVLLKEINRGNGKFCSRKCSDKGRVKSKGELKKFECANCSKIFKSRNRKNKSGLRFCCRKCKDRAQRVGGIKEIQPGHYKDGVTNYRIVAFRHLPKKCNRCDYGKIGNVLEVHHIDRNRNNNSIDNLEILCPTCHCEEHFFNKDGKWACS